MRHIARSVTNNRRSDIARNTAGHQRNVIFLAYSARHAETCAPWKCFIDGRTGVGKLAVFAQRDDSPVDLIMSAPNNVTTLTDAKFSAPRVENGHFAKGGPGRPIGSKNKVSSNIAKQIAALGPRAVAALAEALDERPVPAWAVQCALKYVAPGRLIEFFGCTPDDVKAGRDESQLRRDVAIALFGDTQRVLNTDTDDAAANKWVEVIQS